MVEEGAAWGAEAGPVPPAPPVAVALPMLLRSSVMFGVVPEPLSVLPVT